MISCSTGDSSGLILENCYIEELEETVICGTYEVMENRNVTKGRKFKLKFFILPALTDSPAPDPIVVFDGGPGAGAANNVESWAYFTKKFRQEREILVVDQRGTGSSNPLPCYRIGDSEKAQTYLQDMFPKEYVRKCRKKLEKDNNLNFYHTTLATVDINELCRVLGYHQINLYGLSYGGYMAIVYMKNYPETVRTACIEGPAVPSLLYPSTLAQDTQWVLDRLFADCAADPDCASDYPDLEQEFYSILHRLQQGPVTVDITNPINNQPETVTFTHNNFIHGFRALLYTASGQSWAPAMIWWTYREIYFPIVEYTAEYFYWDNQSLADGMFLCVTCSESIPFIDYEKARAETNNTFMGTYRLDQQQQACELWIRSELPPDFLNPPTQNIPTLIITGDLDPTDRPRTGEFLTQHLPNSLHYNIPNAGHEVGPVWEECIFNVEAQFFSQGSVSGLDFSCADNNQRPPWISWRDYTKKNVKQIAKKIKSLIYKYR
jgi:pimeloyl-ACP methyl ester carboxylesterase